VPNVFEPDWKDRSENPAPFTGPTARLAAQAGSRELGASLFELRPGEATFPLHTHHANEEMLVVLSGRPTLRTLEGARVLEPGEVVAFPTGREGAHRLDNEAPEPARVLILSTVRAPDIVEYPDSDKVGVRGSAPATRSADSDRLRLNFPRDSAVGYWDGETGS
jgi:uncharacterized cupin superfamily protein